jgi:hypothetical protein
MIIYATRLVGIPIAREIRFVSMASVKDAIPGIFLEMIIYATRLVGIPIAREIPFV